MKKRLLFLVVAMFFADAQAQEALPPPKPIEGPQQQGNEQPQDQQALPEQPEQQTLPPPKPLENQENGGRQVYMLVPQGEDFYVMIDPNKGKHLCVMDKRKFIYCRW